LGDDFSFLFREPDTDRYGDDTDAHTCDASHPRDHRPPQRPMLNNAPARRSAPLANPQYRSGCDSVGAAWVFTRKNGIWTQQGLKLVGSGAVGKTWQGAQAR